MTFYYLFDYSGNLHFTHKNWQVLNDIVYDFFYGGNERVISSKLMQYTEKATPEELKYIDHIYDNLLKYNDYSINRCIICKVDMGENNPRQYCCKTYCPYSDS